MKDKQAFIDALDLQQDADGHWFVMGDVNGDVKAMSRDRLLTSFTIHKDTHTSNPWRA